VTPARGRGRLPRPPLRRRISPELSAGLLSVLVLGGLSVTVGPSLVATLGITGFIDGTAGPSGTAAPVALATPATPSVSAVVVTPSPTPEPTPSPTPEPTPSPTPAPTPTPTPTPSPTPAPAPTPTPAPTPSPTPEATPRDPKVNLVIAMNDRLLSIATELTDAAGATPPDVALIASDMSRAMVAIGIADDAAKQLPADLASVAGEARATYATIAAGIGGTLAMSHHNAAAYVKGAKSAAQAIADLAAITAALGGGSRVSP
jgi:hypothetical protein